MTTGLTWRGFLTFIPIYSCVVEKKKVIKVEKKWKEKKTSLVAVRYGRQENFCGIWVIGFLENLGRRTDHG